MNPRMSRVRGALKLLRERWQRRRESKKEEQKEGERKVLTIEDLVNQEAP